MGKQFKSPGWAFVLVAFLLWGCGAEAQGDGQDTVADEQPISTVSVTDINIDRFEGLIEKGEAQILDVRTPGEVSAGGVEGAAHININEADFEEKVAAQLNKEIPVVVYCKAGGRSARAAEQLAGMGFQTVFNYTGGMDEWKSEGKPLDR